MDWCVGPEPKVCAAAAGISRGWEKYGTNRGKKEIEFRYVRGENYKPAYVNGAYGGVNPKGDVVIHFFTEMYPLPDSTFNEFDGNGSVGEQIRAEPGGNPRRPQHLRRRGDVQTVRRRNIRMAGVGAGKMNMYASSQEQYVNCEQSLTPRPVRLVPMSFSARLPGVLYVGSVPIRITECDDGIQLDCEILDIYSFGSDMSRAKEDFVGELRFAWEKYAECDRSELSESAVKYGEKLKKHVKEIDAFVSEIQRCR